jgi:hypothetical protein
LDFIFNSYRHLRVIVQRLFRLYDVFPSLLMRIVTVGVSSSSVSRRRTVSAGRRIGAVGVES